MRPDTDLLIFLRLCSAVFCAGILGWNVTTGLNTVGLIALAVGAWSFWSFLQGVERR